MTEEEALAVLRVISRIDGGWGPRIVGAAQELVDFLPDIAWHAIASKNKEVLSPEDCEDDYIFECLLDGLEEFVEMTDEESEEWDKILSLVWGPKEDD